VYHLVVARLGDMTNSIETNISIWPSTNNSQDPDRCMGEIGKVEPFKSGWFSLSLYSTHTHTHTMVSLARDSLEIKKKEKERSWEKKKYIEGGKKENQKRCCCHHHRNQRIEGTAIKKLNSSRSVRYYSIYLPTTGIKEKRGFISIQPYTYQAVFVP
jgi:hypothetical protein